MKNSLKRLLLLHEMHSFQVIALVGFVMSVVAHLFMLLLDKQLPSYSYIYPTWAAVFIIGFLLNLRSNSNDHHHHH